MAIIEFENGTRVEFEGTPTQADVEEVVKSLNIKKQSKPIFGKYGQALSDFSTGFAKGGLQIARNLGKFGQEVAQQTVGRAIQGLTGVPKEQIGSSLYEGATPQALVPQGGAENVGKFAADVASFAIPQSGVAKAASALPMAARAVTEGVTGAAAAKAQGASNLGAAATGLVSAAIPVAGKYIPKLLSYTTGVGDDAFNVLANRTAQTKSYIGVKPEQILDEAQSAARNARKVLSTQWDEGVQNTINAFTGQRATLKSSIKLRLQDAADTFGVTIPQNLDNISVNEAIGTLKSINELPDALLTVSPKGAAIRALKKELSENFINAFGGKEGELAKLYSNYAVKSEALKAFNQIVNAYKSKNPIAASTARTRLMSIFNENRAAYLDAVKDFEEQFGYDILSKVAGGKFTPVIPEGAGATKLLGNVGKAIDIILLPLTSPRFAAKLQQALNSSAAQAVAPAVVSGTAAQVLPAQSNSDDYINSLGL